MKWLFFIQPQSFENFSFLLILLFVPNGYNLYFCAVTSILYQVSLYAENSIM